MSKLAYMRVSSDDLSIQNQRQVLEQYGIEKYFEDDAISGKSTEGRYGLKSLLEYVRDGDFVYVVALDRLARNQVDQERISAELTLKGAVVVPLDLLDMLGLKEVPTEGVLKMVWDVINVVTRYKAEQERKDMLRRQSEGIKRAQKEGKYKGSLPKYRADATNKKDRNIYFEVVKRLEDKQAMLKIAEELGISRNTVKKIMQRENA
ncbi:resolvase [Enterococcus thailandicus]|uniref:recombinase family protein n=1 Tax=Enterococcus thailandicus TaxID=417368 RepID=UPI00244D8B6D|nr:recombinase family protein [Enterococcus thailandicus]GMC02570.1 resolvase [Enterococcus thailandicus]GMC08993.1 resolvase [Enterococcus thailandicus]